MSGKHRRATPAGQPQLAAPLTQAAATALPSESGAERAGTTGAATATAVLPPPPPPRLAAREQRRARSVRRSRGLAIGAVGLLVLGLVAWAVFTRGGGTGATDGGSGASRTQSTLLVQVVDPQGAALTSVLLAHDTAASGSGLGVLVPSNLVVDVPGFGSSTFGQTTVLAGQDGGAATLADALGILVDGTWVLHTDGLAALVDAVGGVQVDVQDQVLQPRPDGSSTVLVSPGRQKLDGAAAVAYATYRASGEPEESRLARFSDVWQALVSALPAQPAQVSAVVSQLGRGATSTVKPATLGVFLTGLRTDAAAGQVTFQNLPTRTLDTGAAQPAAVLDQQAAADLVSAGLAGSRPPQRPGGPVTVLVQNGVGTPGLGERARDRLVADGLTYVSGGNASSFGYATSVVVVKDATPQSRAQGAEVAKALGLPSSSLRVAGQGQTVADVLVILGRDFKA